jgi:hypothetical protein
VCVIEREGERSLKCSQELCVKVSSEPDYQSRPVYSHTPDM